VSTPDRERLRSIKTFPSLVKYLRDELEWPIESEKFDDLTFEYEPEELGLDADTAVKIKEVKQLRPLHTKQPWGIFFINFEPKSLPVVVLRRILRSLVIKKRQSANKAQQATWKLHDLLFISSYGESDHRDITFAHFSEGPDTGDLPALRVLGWDDEDTVAHLEHAHKTLKEKLLWPENPSDIDKWRATWSQAFILRNREVITTAKGLAVRMAQLATAIRKRVNKVLAIESKRGPLRKLHAAFQEALIHDLNEDDFADMYAQTITYGMLSARVSRPAGLVAENIVDMVPVTNPFLRDLLSTFLTVGGRKGKIDFDELGINEVVQALRDANMEAVLRDFGDKNPQEDPVIHFYELFLKEYDPEKRMKRGVFYTPRPVVSFIVRSVDELLRTDFCLADGLADITTWGEMVKRQPDLKIPKGAKPDDPFVQILDPATGTGTFLVEVIDVIQKTMNAKWQKQGKTGKAIDLLWNQYVVEHLLPRLYGFELMMAPYAIAHMKIGLKLHETGYNFASHERARIYLTNSLEEPQDFSDRFEFDAPALAHEARAVNTVKEKVLFTIIVGNPPYSGHSVNDSDWIRELLRKKLKDGAGSYFQVDGIDLGERNPKWLNDDYVKFLRYGHYRISEDGIGILAFITNHGYLSNPTFRGMRQSLSGTFQKICLLDLHGNSKIKERNPDGSIDQNVFEIQQGVAIGVFVKFPRRVNPSHTVHHADLWGNQENKYRWLTGNSLASTRLTTLSPCLPFFMFVPQDENLRLEYGQWKKATEIMPVYVLGFQTHRDNFAIDFDEARLNERLDDFRSTKYSDREIRTKYDLADNRDWNIASAREQLRSDQKWKRHFTRCLYRPFDWRACYFSTVTMDYPRRELLDHVSGKDNLILNISRIVKLDSWRHAVISTVPPTAISLDINGSYVFPLFLYQNDDKKDLFSVNKHSNSYENRVPNLNSRFIDDLSKRLKLSYVSESKSISDKSFSPIDVLAYFYAVLYSPTYHKRYVEFLKIDFPHLPLPGHMELFRAMAKLGGELVALHLMESSKLDKHLTKFIGSGRSEIEKISYSDKTVWIDKERTQGFRGVPENVWNFYVGGYQVCDKWLKDRKARKLSKADIEHYNRIVVALHETIRLMAEIDKVINAHGGWPGAFATEKCLGSGLAIAHRAK
jgi:predicted helicase